MDPKTAGTWAVERHVCQASRVMQAEAENDAETRARGVRYAAYRTTK